MQTYEESYFGSLNASRAAQLSSKEYERLIDAIQSGFAETWSSLKEMRPEVRRSPGRCIVQVGTAALTVSWVRTIREELAEGRLMIIEWEGRIGHAADVIPERTLHRAGPVQTARVVRQTEFVSDAEKQDHWYWRQADDASQTFETAALATRCLDSLSTRARK